MSDVTVLPESLLAALLNVQRATDARGLKVRLCRDALNVKAVRRDLHNMCQWFHPEAIFIDDGEETAARNLALLADLLSEHLKYRRKQPESGEWKPPT